MLKIFISYSRANRPQVETIEQMLRALGNDAWFDREIDAGALWWKAIVKEIQTCDIFVFALSPQSLSSPACKAEIAYARALNKPILPIMLIKADVALSSVSEIQYVDGRNLADKSVTTSLSRALLGLQHRLLSGEFQPPAETPSEPPIPYYSDPLQEVRQQVADLKGIADLEVIKSIYTIKSISQQNKNTINEARILLRQIIDSPNVTQGVAKEARETLIALGGGFTDQPIFRMSLAAIIVALGFILFLVVTNRGNNVGVSTPIPTVNSNLVGVPTDQNSGGIILLTETLMPAPTETLTPTSTETMPSTAAPTETLTLAPTETLTPTPTETMTSAPTETLTPTPTDTLTPAPTETLTPTPILMALSINNVSTIQEMEVSPLVGHSANMDINTVAFSPDGALLASGGEDHIVFLWSTVDWSIVETYSFASPVNSVMFSPNNTQLAVGLDNPSNIVTVINLESGERLFTGEHGFQVNDVRFSADGQLLASASSDGTVKLWDFQSDEPVRTITHSTEGGAWRVRFSPNSQNLAIAGSDGRVTIRNLQTGNLINALEVIDSALVQDESGRDARIDGLAFSNDGRTIMITSGGGQGDGVLRFWDVRTDALRFGDGFSDKLTSGLALSGDERILITISYNRWVSFWDTTELNLIHQINIQDPPYNATGNGTIIESLAIHLSRPLIAIGSRDGRIRLLGLPENE